MKKVLIMCAVVAATLCAMADTWTDPATGITWTYTVSGGEASVGGGSSHKTAVPTSTTGAITIPSTLGGYPVTSIGNYAFYDCSSLASVTIPSSVTKIDERAFNGCSGLTIMTIPSSVTSIGTYAFSGCESMKRVVIPSSVTRISDFAFYRCEAVKDATLPGWNCTLSLSSATNVVISSGTTDIKEWGFAERSALLHVEIPSSVTSIGTRAFDKCSGLTHLEIPSSVTSIGQYAFADCSGLTRLEVPSSATSIGWFAFSNCSKIKDLTFPGRGSSGISMSSVTNLIISEGVTSIAENEYNNAYWRDCSNLKHVTLPSSLTTIGNNAFRKCGELSELTIPDSVTSVGSWAFFACSKLTSLTISTNMTAINERTFCSCSSLTSVVIPPNVTSLGADAFSACDQLSKIVLSNGLASIGDYAFSGCSASHLTIPSSVTSMGKKVFDKCDELNAIDFEGAPPNGLSGVGIKKDAAIRYNAAFSTEWEAAIAQCGFTNATPYVPYPPVISPASGTMFDSSLTVSMTCESQGATIHYTVDGSTPTMESSVYKRFKIYGKTTVKAVAFVADGTPSEMAVAEYAKGCCEVPIVTPPDGTMFEHSGLIVSLAHDNPEGVLRYTTDGNDPTSESPEYTEPFTIDETTTVKAKVFGDQYFDSPVVTATLTRVRMKVATPEIATEAQFTGSKQRVDIVCATEGATVRYTTDGTDPNSDSPEYTKPFYVTDTTTVKAYATKADYTNSDIATFLITKAWGIGDTMGKPDHTFETGGAKGFVRVEDKTATLGESMKSGAITDSEKSILSTTVIGPGTLTFKWKASCEGDDDYEWDHGEFRVNGELKGRINGITDWIEVSQRIDGEGTNTVTWTYVKDENESVEQDCIWVSDYAWASDYTETQTTEVPVPYDWLLQKSRDAVDEYDIYEKVAKQTAYNPRFTVEQCYVAGLDPESTTNEFTSAITMEGGIPKITWMPDLGEEREYKVWGKASLIGGDWQYPTNSLHRFFKVSVEMPQ